ncbi:uncharacterized protein LOC124063914 [Xyrichtys novacula]|uniref:Uncharacterized protein LOC124063914 n=1 Tax=Xyrichtys novacula TaxID=13765 RepID=A0AAV1F1W1_XYRNO|nr:uncharacterized protein LOC124063914 [Xyrichtys novacula]
MWSDLRYKCTCSCLHVVIGFGAFLLLAFPIAEIILGAVYLHECPISPLLPVYLVVLGVFTLMLLALCAVPRFHPTVYDHCIMPVSIVTVTLFILAWFLYGSYLIYSIYEPNYIKPTTTNPGISTVTPATPNYTSNPSSFTSATANYTRNPSNFTSATPNYTKNPSSFTSVTSNDTKTMISSGSFNSSIFTPKYPDNKLNSTLDQSQNQSLPVANQVGIITNNNQTLMKLIRTLSLSTSSTQTNSEPLNAPQKGEMKAEDLYCNRHMYLFAFGTTTLVYLSIAVLCSKSSVSVKCE